MHKKQKKNIISEMCFTACQTIQFLKFTGYLLYTSPQPPTPKYQTNKQTNKKNHPKCLWLEVLYFKFKGD